MAQGARSLKGVTKLQRCTTTRMAIVQGKGQRDWDCVTFGMRTLVQHAKCTSGTRGDCAHTSRCLRAEWGVIFTQLTEFYSPLALNVSSRADINFCARG